MKMKMKYENKQKHENNNGMAKIISIIVENNESEISKERK
jgi:hypothetical protein